MTNSILVLSDEHNPRVMGHAGHPLVQTPAMDRMAREGASFATCYCPSPLCVPSRSALFAGERVHQIQMYTNCRRRPWQPPADRAPTYGAALSDAGVHSAYHGKTHVYLDGADLAFDDILMDPLPVGPGDTNFRRKPLAIRPNAEQRANDAGPREDAHQREFQQIDEAIAWLREVAPTLDRPWHLTISLFNEPHFPQWTTPDRWQRYEAGADLPRRSASTATGQHPYMQDLRAHFQTEKFSETQIRNLRRGYLGCVDAVDTLLGQLLDHLDASGLATTTDTYYSSDHGEMLGEFGMWWKCTLLEDSARIPCLAIGPSFTGRGQCTTPVDLHDIRASCFRSCGVDQPSGWLGTPLQDLPDHDPERVVFSEYHGHGTRSGSFMVRKGDWKLIWCAEAPHLLFDLASDADELQDRSADRPDKLAELEAALRSICDPEAANERATAFNEALLEERLAGD